MPLCYQKAMMKPKGRSIMLHNPKVWIQHTSLLHKSISNHKLHLYICKLYKLQHLTEKLLGESEQTASLSIYFWCQARSSWATWMPCDLRPLEWRGDRAHVCRTSRYVASVPLITFYWIYYLSPFFPVYWFVLLKMPVALDLMYCIRLLQLKHMD